MMLMKKSVQAALITLSAFFLSTIILSIRFMSLHKFLLERSITIVDKKVMKIRNEFLHFRTSFIDVFATIYELKQVE
jgi:hypothetical protein